MKKLLLTAAFITFFSLANAQTDEGGWLLGGATTLNFSSTSIDNVDDNVNNFNFQGNAGYFLIENLAAGLLWGFNNTSQGDFSANSTLFGHLEDTISMVFSMWELDMASKVLRRTMVVRRVKQMEEQLF